MTVRVRLWWVRGVGLYVSTTAHILVIILSSEAAAAAFNPFSSGWKPILLGFPNLYRKVLKLVFFLNRTD